MTDKQPEVRSDIDKICLAVMADTEALEDAKMTLEVIMKTDSGVYDEMINDTLSLIRKALSSSILSIVDKLEQREWTDEEKSRSQKMREAGYTQRDTRLKCDVCGEKFSRLMLPIHDCEIAQPEQEPHDYRTRYDRPCYKCGSMYCPANCKDNSPLKPEQEPVGEDND